MKRVTFLILSVLKMLLVDSALAQTWTETPAPTNYWSSIASSADGSKLVAVAGGGGAAANWGNHTSPIYLSTNFGTLWFQTTVPSNYWSAVASSGDGTKLVAVAGSSTFFAGVIYNSTNAGLTWASNDVPKVPWSAVACSADGSKIFAATLDGQLFITTNFGTTWNPTSGPNEGEVSIACSADGSKLIAGPDNYPGRICTSTNFGATWVINNSPATF